MIEISKTYIMRKEMLENMTLIGHTEGKRGTWKLSNIHNDLL